MTATKSMPEPHKRRLDMLAHRIRGRPLPAIAALLLAVTICIAVLAPWLNIASPNQMNISQRLTPPSAEHLLGTDEFGRDILSRVIYGARVSLLLGVLVVVLSCVVGTLIGLLAGYNRRLDATLMRFADAMMAFPDILLAIALLASLGPSMMNVVVALSIVYTPRVARVMRGTILVLRELPYIEAAEISGASHIQIIFRHLLPNSLSPLLVQATFIFAYAMLTEAALSFLGAGVPPTIPTWGNMIATAQQYMHHAVWLIFAPGVAIVVMVVSLQMLGDGLRDMLDPRLSRLV